MGLFPLAENTNSVVLFTSTAWICAVALELNEQRRQLETERLQTFDFFSRHLSQALHTRLRALASESIECLEGDDTLSVTMSEYYVEIRWGLSRPDIGE
jgi:hypothetical protein